MTQNTNLRPLSGHVGRLLSLALFNLGAFAFPQGEHDEGAKKIVDAYLRSSGTVGVSVAVIQDGQTELILCGGFADREKRKRVVPGTIFRLGSISKPITAVGAMRLVEKGKLGLDDTLDKLVPEWPKDKAPITLRQLMSHTSGVRHYTDSPKDPTNRVFRHYTTGQAVGLFAKDPLLFPPGTKESYSTHAFTLVARSIETASGRYFVDYMRESVFRLPGEELDCEVATDSKAARSSLYVMSGKTAKVQTQREDNSWKFGGGGMEATATGLARWADAVRQGKLVNQQSLDTMWSPAALNDGTKLKYGLGWGVNGTVRSHTGSQQGCLTFMSVNLETGLTVVVLTNTSGTNGDISALGAKIAALWN